MFQLTRMICRRKPDTGREQARCVPFLFVYLKLGLNFGYVGLTRVDSRKFQNGCLLKLQCLWAKGRSNIYIGIGYFYQCPRSGPMAEPSVRLVRSVYSRV